MKFSVVSIYNPKVREATGQQKYNPTTNSMDDVWKNTDETDDRAITVRAKDCPVVQGIKELTKAQLSSIAKAVGQTELLVQHDNWYVIRTNVSERTGDRFLNMAPKLDAVEVEL